MRINLNKKTINYIYLGILFIIALFFLFYNLGASSLQDWDEGVYAQISHEVSWQHGLTMFLNNEPILEKPPLGYLVEAFFIEIIGFSEFGIRFSSSLFLLGSILLIYLLGKRLWNEHVGFWAALLTLISPALLHQHMARSGDLDAGLLFFTILAFYLLLVAEDKPRLFWLSGLAAGLGIMTRGSSGLFIIVISLLYLAINKKLRNFSWKNYLWYVVVVLLVVLPWHIYEYLLYGQQFLNVYLSEHFVGRIAAPLQNHPGAWFYYFKYLIDTMGLMFWLAVLAFIYACYRWFKTKDKQISLIISWLVVTLLPLMIMQTKLYWYAITVIPALYFLLVYFIYAIINPQRKPALCHSECNEESVKSQILHFVQDDSRGQRASFRPTQITAMVGFLVIAFCLVVNLFYLKTDLQLVLNPHISPVNAVANYLFSQEIPKPVNLVVYNVLAWEKGWILPSAKYYLELKNGGQTYLIGANNLEHYIDRDQYTYFLTNEAGLADIRAKGGDKYQFNRDFVYGDLRLIIKSKKF